MTMHQTEPTGSRTIFYLALFFIFIFVMNAIAVPHLGFGSAVLKFLNWAMACSMGVVAYENRDAA